MRRGHNDTSNYFVLSVNRYLIFAIFNGVLRKRICATTCYLNPLEKDCFLAKMSEISGFDAIIFRIFKYIAFR